MRNSSKAKWRTASAITIGVALTLVPRPTVVADVLPPCGPLRMFSISTVSGALALEIAASIDGGQLLPIDLFESVIAQTRTACAAETKVGALSFRRQAACKGLQSANRPLANEIRGRPRPDRRERLRKKAACTTAARKLAKHKVIRG